MSEQNENARLLKILEDHGQSFLDSFSAIDYGKKKRKNSPNEPTTPEKKRKVENTSSDEQEEWFGINNILASEHDSGDEEECNQTGSGTLLTYDVLYRQALSCSPLSRI
jgi:hypothetical protein